MNVSMQDTFNLAWKLAAVLERRSEPNLLHTYSAERQAVAKDLIDFDKEWSATIAQRPLDAGHPEQGGIDPSDLQAAFTRSGRYTAGLATQYTRSPLTGGGEHQALAKGFSVGMRFHSAPVARIADAKLLQLGHVHEADGRGGCTCSPMQLEGGPGRCSVTSRRWGPVLRFTPEAADPDGIFDVRAVFQQNHWELEVSDLPQVLHPQKGRLGLRDYEKAFSRAPGKGGDIFDLRGIDLVRRARWSSSGPISMWPRCCRSTPSVSSPPSSAGSWRNWSDRRGSQGTRASAPHRTPDQAGSATPSGVVAGARLNRGLQRAVRRADGPRAQPRRQPE